MRKYQIGGEVEDDTGDDFGVGPLSQMDPATALMSVFAQQYTTSPEAQQYSRDILNQILEQQRSPGATSVAMDAMRKQAEQVRAALRDARTRLEGEKPFNRAELLLGIGRGLGAPTRTGAIGETASNVAGQLQPLAQRRTAFETEQNEGLRELDLALAQADQPVISAEFELQKLRETLQNRMAIEALDNLGKSVRGRNNGLGDVIPEAAQAVDRAYAPEYTEFIGGGQTRAAQGLDTLGFALDVLKSGKDALSGPYAGAVANLPYVGRWAQAFVSPQGADVRDLIEYVVQEQLRPILGSQFTREEGERLISRLYNTNLEEPYNARRLEAFIQQLNRAFENRINMARYFRQNGTLFKYPGQIGYSVDDFNFGEDESDDTVRFQDLPQRERETQLQVWREMNPGKEPPEEMLRAEGGRVAYQEGGQVQPPRVVFPTDEETEESPALGAEQSGWDKLMQMLDLAGMAPDMLLGLGGGLGAEHLLTNIQRNLIGVPEQRAEAAMHRAGIDAVSQAKEIKRARRNDVPMTLMDTDAPGINVLAEEGFRYGEGEAGHALRELRQRVEGHRERVNKRINKSLKPYEYFDLENQLMNRIGRTRRQEMQDVFDQYPAMKMDPVITQILATPEGKGFLKDAMRYYENVPGRKPGQMTIDGMIAKPSLEFYDYIRKAMDDRIGRAERGGPTEFSQDVLRPLRQSFIDRIDAMAPDYKTSRMDLGTDLEIRDALRQGRNFMSLQPEQLAEIAPRLSFHEKNAYLTGVAQKLYEMLDRSSAENFAAAQKIVGSPATMARIEPFLDPADFKVFQDALRQEADLFRTSRENLRLGESAMYEREKGRMSPMEWLQKKAPGFRFAIAPMGMALRYMRDRPRLTKEEASRVLGLLRQGRPQDMDAFMNRAARLGRLRNRRGARGAAAAGLGAAAGAGLYMLRNSDDMGEEE